MGNKLDRRGVLAKRLALWSISDQISHDAVDKEVMRFSQANENLSNELKTVENQIGELLNKRKEVSRELIASCKSNIASLEKQTPNSVARPLVDLAFWNRMSDLNPDLYNLLHPRLEEIGDEGNKK